MTRVGTLSSKGQITIPKDVRKLLSLKQEDQLIFTVTDGDTLVLKPLKKNFLDFGGTVSPKSKPENFEKIRETVMKSVGKAAALENSEQ